MKQIHISEVARWPTEGLETLIPRPDDGESIMILSSVECVRPDWFAQKFSKGDSK